MQLPHMLLTWHAHEVHYGQFGTYVVPFVFRFDIIYNFYSNFCFYQFQLCVLYLILQLLSRVNYIFNYDFIIIFIVLFKFLVKN